MSVTSAVKQLFEFLKPKSKRTRRELESQNTNQPSDNQDDIPRAYHVEDENNPVGYELVRMRTPVLVRQ